MTRIYLTLIAVLFAFTTVKAQQESSPTPLSLQDCMDYAVKHNYTLKNAQLDILIQQAQNNQTVSASMPHVNAKADYNYFNVVQRSFIDANAFPTGGPKAPDGTVVPIEFTLPYAGSANITTSQTIFDGAVTIALKARKTVMELARLNKDVTEENIRYNIFKSYNSLVIANRQYDIIKQTLLYFRSMERDLAVTRENGFAEKIDVERMSVQINNLASDSIRIGNMLTLSEQVLKYQIGMEINKPIVLTDTVIEERKQATLALLEEQINYDRIPTYAVLNTAVKLNEFNLKRYQLAALPSLNAFWSYGINYGAFKGVDLLKIPKYFASSTLGLSLTMPIFNGFLRVNQVKETMLNVEKSKNNLENFKQTTEFLDAQARTSLKNAIIQVRSQRSNMELATDVLDLARRKYKEGVGSNAEVTQAQTELLRAQTNYFNALLDIINAQADLKKALGLLK